MVFTFLLVVGVYASEEIFETMIAIGRANDIWVQNNVENNCWDVFASSLVFEAFCGYVIILIYCQHHFKTSVMYLHVVQICILKSV